MNEVWINFHIPHDYVPGTQIYFHTHWSNPAATPNTGNVVWGFDYTFARGGLASGTANGAFPATSNITVTAACPAVSGTHNISETTGITITGLEVDGVIMVRVYRDATNVADTCTDPVFLHLVDAHYQSTNIATKSKTAGNFYV